LGKLQSKALELGKVGVGSTVLIQGGAGGVGSQAIQIVHKADAHVVTTARSKQQDALFRLGAGRVIDFTQERFEKEVEPVDVVLYRGQLATLANSESARPDDSDAGAG
jgi:NADPH:quinone reductase-like Zn-dependent oxidoreductase